MGLIDEKTKWIFLLPSARGAEERCVYDVAFGVTCLESQSIDTEDIRLFIDCADDSEIEALLETVLSKKYTFKPSNMLFDELVDNTHENIVLFVAGHGNIYGLDGAPQITPHKLFSEIKKNKHLKLGVVFLSQCYAGVFNYMDVSEKKDPQTGVDAPPIIVIGATNLFTSISAPTTETLRSNKKTWVANIFLLNLFRWVQEPKDIDGDGKYTVMDWYKFAGAQTNTAYINLKCKEFEKLLDHFQNLKRMKKGLEDFKKQLEHDALEAKYKKMLQNQFNHQERWILQGLQVSSRL